LRAKIIDGKLMAQVVFNEVRSEVEAWVASGRRRPHLVAVLVGNDPASAIYVRNKMKAAEYTG
jgi:5,10-methylene-tetrahydrofolate dehydrogenase/methenyl tetrahydrofolate cyclohydrolase